MQLRTPSLLGVDAITMVLRPLRPLDLFAALDGAGVEVRGFHRGRTLEAAYMALVKGAKNSHASPDPTPTIP